MHGRTLRAFKQQVPGRFCEDGKTKSRCQFWQAMRAHCQVVARLGREAVSRAKMGPVTRAHRPRLLHVAAGTGWLQVQPKTQRWERGQQNSRLTWLFWPGSFLNAAGGPGGELPDEVSQRSSSPRCSFPCCQALACGAAILELASGWLGNGGQGSRARRCLQSCGSAGESSAG